MTALLAAAALAAVLALLWPAAARWAWASAALLVAVAAGLGGGLLVGMPLLIGVVVATAIEPAAVPVEVHFEGLVARLVAIGVGAVAGILVVVRVLGEDLGAGLVTFQVVAMGVAVLIHELATPSGAGPRGGARLGVLLAAAGWALGGHHGAVVPLAAALLLVGLAWLGHPPRLAGTAARPAVPVLLVAAAGAAVLLLAHPGSSLGTGIEGVSLSGLSRGAAWLVLLGTCLALAASLAAGQRWPPRAWLVPALGVALALLRMPALLVGITLVAALALPFMTDAAPGPPWSRSLLLAALAVSAGVAAAVVGRLHGDETLAGLLVVGFLVLLGMAPFGWPMLRWLEAAPPALAALVMAAFLPGALAALAAIQPSLVGLHEALRAGILFGAFGAATAVVGALYAMGSRDWRTLAVRTLPVDVGMAVVGVAAFDIRGLQAAALTLALLVCTRPALLFADAIGPRRGAGLLATAVALVGMAGLPPLVGFPARLLVLGSAVRLHPALAALVVAAMVLEVGAVALVLRRRLAMPGEDPGGRRDAPTGALAALTAVSLLAGGVFPGLVLRFAFNLSG